MIRGMGFHKYKVIKAYGFSGGIWLLWKREISKLRCQKRIFHFLHVNLVGDNVPSWILTVVYGSPREGDRGATWENLRTITTSMHNLWLVLGDFNVIASPTEQKGGAPPNINKCDESFEWIHDCNLLEVTTVGSRFTWRGPNGITETECLRGWTVCCVILKGDSSSKKASQGFCPGSNRTTTP